MIRALIVDDDALFGRTLADRLQRSVETTFTVAVATTADEALHLAQSDAPFDVFLIDQRLGPGPTGIELLEKLRSISPNSEAIIFTGLDDPDAGLQAYQAGAHRYLAKPFDTHELIWILRSLRRWRETQYERDWLRVLTDVAEEVQGAISVQKVADIVVRGGRRLGFERARLWRLSDDQQTLIGASQNGNVGLEDFAGCRMLLTEAPYIQRALEKREPVYFNGDEEGFTYLMRRFGSCGFAPPVGDWVHMPLYSRDHCWGVLSLDNADQSRPLHPEQRRLLWLYGRQATAALERARLYELETRKSKELEILNQIGRHVTARAVQDDLEALLHIVHKQVASLLDVSDFAVALLEAADAQIAFPLYVKNGHKRPRPHQPSGEGIIGHLIQRNEPLLLRQGTRQYCRTHGIAAPHRHRSCWLGAPLRVEEQAIGALVVQSDKPNVYDEDDLRLLTAVADQVAGVIQTVRLKDQETENSRRLEVLHHGSETLLQLAEQNEEWLWHATLTAATADYALRFNRATVFLVDPDGVFLRGRRGIGHFDGRQARQHWIRDKRRSFRFRDYLERLKSGKLEAMPVDQVVREMRFVVHEVGGAFAQALNEGRCIIVAADQAEQLLPPAFVERFGAAEYAILPLRAGNKILGLVTVDNIHNAEPLRSAQIEQLETLLAQVALILENLRQREARDRLIHLNYIVMADVSNRSLRETLKQICAAAQASTGADSVVIYPIRQGQTRDEFIYDTESIGHLGFREAIHPKTKPRKKGVTAHILQSSPFIVTDVRHANWFEGQVLADHAFIQREGIQSFIGLPVHDVASDEICGAFYINYRKPKMFNDWDIQQAEAFASLAGVAIRNGWIGQRTRSRLIASETQSQVRRRELAVLRRVLETALQSEVNEERIITSLLEAARELIDQYQISAWATLVLRRWQKPDVANQEPREVRYLYELRSDGNPAVLIEEDIYRGISGQALRTGYAQMAADVRHDDWNKLFYAFAVQDTRSELDVPIKLNSGVLGVLNIESPDVGVFTETHRTSFERLAAVAALALDSVRRQENLRNVLEASQVIVSPSTLHDTMEAMARVARQVAPEISALAIWRLGPYTRRITLGAHFGLSGDPTLDTASGAYDAIVKLVMEATDPIWAPVAAEAPCFRDSPLAQQQQITSIAAFPLRASNEVVGAMFFNYRQQHAFSNQEQVLFPIIAAIAASSMRGALQLETTRKERDQRDAALAITDAIGATLELGEILRRVMRKLRELFPHATPCVMTYDRDENILVFTKESFELYQIDNPDYARMTRIPFDGPSLAGAMARQSLQSKQVELINEGDVERNPDYLKMICRTRSELCVTLMQGEQLLGVLVLESQRLHAFDDDDAALFRGIGQQVSIAIGRAYQSAQLSFHATAVAATAWAAEIAHDINHEIGIIRSRAYWLNEEWNLSSEGRQSVREIDESAKRLIGTLPGGGHRDTFFTEALQLDTNLEQWTREIVAKRGAGAATLASEFNYAGAPVHASPIALKRVLRHLVLNALDATHNAGKLTIRTRAVEDTWVEIEVEDDGPGVPDFLRPQIFQQRVTTKPGNGGGLGLIVVRLLVEDMGGTVRLLPAAPGRGATFAFRLKRAKAKE